MQLETALSLNYLVREPKINTNNPSVIILIHGYGSNEQDLYSFANELPDELLVISVRAPQTLAHGSYSWYTISFDMDNGKFSDDDEALESRDLLVKFIGEIKERYAINNKVFLLGFSQGAILSYAIAMKYPNQVNHIVALSGYVNLNIMPSKIDTEAVSKVDFFVSHGLVDQVIPLEWAQETPKFLNDYNIEHIYKEYPVGHGVAPQNFYDFKDWILKRL